MAGVSTKEIKSRIRSMESTKQITKAMEMVASSKLRHAQQKALSTRPYFEILYDTVSKIVSSNGDLSSPYLEKRKVEKTVYVVIAGDRGLAGGYNSNILKLVQREMADREALMLPIGKKAVDDYRSHKVPVLTQIYAQAEELSVGDCFSIAKQLCRGYLAGQYDEIVVAYTGFASALRQIPTMLRLLPLTQTEGKKEQSGDILYEPSSEEVFDRIIPEYLGGILYGALCESRCSEQAARRMAMDSATQNAGDMIDMLRLKFNQARQAAITQEITEIVAGS